MEALMSLAGVIVGWLLNELSQSLRIRADDKRAIARALADLLEIRHRTFGMKAVFDELGKRFSLPSNFQIVVLSYFGGVLPDTDTLSKRYNEAVDAVASADPTLAYRLRAKDLLTPLLQTLRDIAAKDDNFAELWPQFESQLMQLIKSPLDEIILELARLHSWRQWFRVRKRLNQPFIGKDFDEYLKTIESLISSQPTQNDVRSSV